MTAPHTRTLGRSTVPVTALTLGTAALGNLFTAITDDQAAATVEAAWTAGIRSFDTAPHYGLGLSERRLGRALAGRPRTDYTLSSKVGRILVPHDRPGEDDLAHGFAVPAGHTRVWDFTADGVRRSIEHSLIRLGLDRLDVALLHDPDDHAEAAFHQAYPALERLRAEGVVGAIGAGMNQTDMLTRFVTDTDVDVVLLAGRHTLLDHSGLTGLLPAAHERGVSVLAGGVFNSGLLADPGPGARYDYAPAPPHVLSRAMRLRAVVERHGVPLRAAALHYPPAHPAVAGVLIGARSPEEVEDAVAVMRRPVPAAVWDDLKGEGLLPAWAPTP
ncbi:aldo/keto reductase [Streptomyces sp. AC627_RSS907]|uniref:aldo/keto reductase n=1 Tax=Streptomyces sp. AC627_RSS907 TaxID=2823684 RepID=UPI001C223ECE|nr:aldo/keto reductase [Streptomyces sp. AC627_RSS907]